MSDEQQWQELPSDNPAAPEPLTIDGAIKLLQRAKAHGAVHLMAQFNRDGKGYEGLYCGSWHDAEDPKFFRLCFANVDPDEWISGYDDEAWARLWVESEASAAELIARARLGDAGGS